MTELVFVETVDAVESLLEARGRGQLEDATIVALSPWVAYQLQRVHVSFAMPHDYVTMADRERLGDVNLRRAELLVETIDGTVTKGLNRASADFRPAYGEFFYLKVLLDAISYRILELRSAIAATKADTIFYFPMDDSQPVPQRLDFMAEPIYTRLLPRVAEAEGRRLSALNATRWPFPPPVNPRRLTAAKTVKNLAAIVEPALAGLRSTGRPTTVLALDSCLNSELARSKLHRLIVWRAGSSRALSLGGVPRVLDASADVSMPSGDAFERCWAELWSGGHLRPLLTQDGIPFGDLVETKLRYLVTEIAPSRLRLQLVSADLLRRWAIDVVLSYSYAQGPERAVAQAARGAGIPVVLYDHGALGYFNYPLERHLDAGTADYRLVWGDGVRAHIEQRFPGSVTSFAVGGAMLDPLINKPGSLRRIARKRLCRRLGFDAGRPIVVYCATALATNMQYAGHLVVPDMVYVESQIRIVRFLGRFTDTQVIVKLHPSPYYPQPPLADLIRDEGLTNCRIISSIPFPEILDIADLFITDSPTTTLLQMLTTPTPVIVFVNAAIELEPDAVESLKSVAFVADRTDRFEEELERRLSPGTLGRVHEPDTRFIRSYGTYLHDGRSAQRAVAALNQIVEEHKRQPMPLTADTQGR
jgi:hypothetical protein